MKIEVVEQSKIRTDFRYAIVAGWLIIPALLLGLDIATVIYVLFTYNPTALRGYELFVYITDVLLAFFYAFILFAWIARKRVLPKLMITTYIIDLLLYIPLMLVGAGMNWIALLFSALWVGYFIKSKRVKATFIK